MESYVDFSRFYDRLTSNVDYKALCAYYDGLVTEFGGKKGALTDLACGTGSLSVLFSKLGCNVIGVDASQEMLSIALTKPHKNILYICQPMQQLKLLDKADVTICSLDSINHLPDKAAVKATFKRVAQFTEDGGLFLFDVNTTYKHKKILGNETFVYDLDDLYCVWQNELDDEDTKNCRVNMYLDFFTLENGGYQRYYDELSEIAFSSAEISKMLLNSGFEILDIFEYPTHNKPTRMSEKLTFVARKGKGI